ncbi:MAG: histidine phosphatase family protein [Acidimicrobiia bacterium]|jgi:broad specificity phosphatase PhoE
MAPVVILVRHGETEWTLSGQHTGRTDIPLTDNGRAQARRLCKELASRDLALVLSSPSSRALETARLAGLGDQVQTTEDLMEWDYGEYEGVTTAEIRSKKTKWSLWIDGAPGGESPADVGARVDEVIREVRDVLDEAESDVALFAHGHVLRVLTARWLGLTPADGRLFALDPATFSLLGYERENPVVRRWNDPAGAL